MADLTQLLYSEVLPKLNFHSLFSPLQLIDRSHYFNATCPKCSTKNKLFIYKDTGRVLCNTCEYKSSPIDFPQEYKSLSAEEFIKRCETLFAAAGVPFPKEQTEKQVVHYKAIQQRRLLYEDFLDICKKSLHEHGGLKYKEASEYLLTRSITLDIAKKFELGFYPSIDDIYKQLRAKGHSEEAILKSGIWAPDPRLAKTDEEKTLFYANGKAWENRIICPIREHKNIVSFWGRDITGAREAKHKYKYLSSGYGKTYPYLLNKVHGTDAVLVEGQFDALALSAHGIQNVIAVGGINSFNKNAYEILQHQGIAEVTLLFDNDSAGIEGVLEAIERHANGDITVYVVPPESLGEPGTDPDKFVKEHGAPALQGLLDNAQYGFVYKAQHDIKKHKGDGNWTDKGIEGVSRTARKFVEKITNKLRYIELGAYKQYLQKNLSIDSDAFEALMISIEEKKEAEVQRANAQELENKIAQLNKEGKYLEVPKLILKHVDELRAQESSKATKPILNAADFLEQHDKQLKKYAGKQLMGFPQKTIPELDNKLSGLRKLIVLGGGPNTGKTTFTIQQGIDVVLNNPDICLVFVSLEMSGEDIYARIRCFLAGITYKKLIFDDLDLEQRKRLEVANNTLKEIGNRIRIIDNDSCPNITLETLKAHIEKIKQETDTSHAMVVVDYLQVWPTTEATASRSDNQLDDWRIEQMRMLRDAVNHDPVLVISEIRKPSGTGAAWSSTAMSDFKGSGRIAYTPDAAMMLIALDEEDIVHRYKTHISADWDSAQIKEYSNRIREFYKKLNCSISLLHIDKARDGMERGDIYLKYYYFENRYEPLNWEEIKNLLQIDESEKGSNKNPVDKTGGATRAPKVLTPSSNELLQSQHTGRETQITIIAGPLKPSLRSQRKQHS